MVQDFEKAKIATFEDGLNTAWELADLVVYKYAETMTRQEYIDCFGAELYNAMHDNVFRNYKVTTIYKKYKTWLEKTNQVKCGKCKRHISSDYIFCPFCSNRIRPDYP